jgi:hypothetical protein
MGRAVVAACVCLLSLGGCKTLEQSTSEFAPAVESSSVESFSASYQSALQRTVLLYRDCLNRAYVSRSQLAAGRASRDRVAEEAFSDCRTEEGAMLSLYSPDGLNLFAGYKLRAKYWLMATGAVPEDVWQAPPPR